MIIITNLQGESLPLTDVKSVAKKVGRNGVNEIDLVVHRTDSNSKAFDLIEREGILTVEENDYRIKRNIREQKDKTVGFRIEAPHVFYDNIDVYQHDVHEGEKVLTLHQALTFSLENTGYTFIIKDDFDNYSFENFGNDTSIALFNKAKDSFKFEFSIENKHLTIVKRLGKDNGHQLRYKHGIQTISVEDSTHDLSTYIQGFGALRKDEEGNDIEGDYLVTAEYTSPHADKYDRIIEATPVDDRRFSNKDALLRQMVSELNDDPTMLFTITHEKFNENLVTEMEDVGLGDVVQLIHEPLNLLFEVRIEEIISFPLHPRLKPLLTISNKPLELLDHNALSVANKQNNDKQLAELRNKNNEFSRRIESAIEAVHDVENAMIKVDKEMDRIENEVIPEIEQAVKDSTIPSQVDPPYPIPNSKLWNDTSVNPPRLMRYDGTDWVVLAPTEDEIDIIIEGMKDEAIRQGITYTDAEVKAARSAINTQIESEIGDVSEHITGLEDTASNLINRANATDELLDAHGGKITSIERNVDEVEGQVSTVITDVSKIDDTVTSHTNEITANAKAIGAKLESTDYEDDKTGILSSIEKNTTDIETTAKGLELTVTKEEFDNLEIGGRNLLRNSNRPSNLDHWHSDSSLFQVARASILDENVFKINGSGGNPITVYSDYYDCDSNQKYTLSMLIYSSTARSELIQIEEKGGDTITVFDREASGSSYPFISKTFKTSVSASQFRLKISRMVGSQQNFTRVQIEKGNKATAYQDAPEDTLERITKTEATIDVHAEAIELKAERDELVNYVDKQEYTNKTGQLDVSIDNIIGRVSKAETTADKHTGEIESASSKIAEIVTDVDGITSTVSNLNQDMTTANQSISRIEQKADGVITTVGKVQTDVGALEGDMTTVKTTVEQMPDKISFAVTEGIDGLEIGGRNLFVNTETFGSPWDSKGSRYADAFGGKNAVKISGGELFGYKVSGANMSKFEPANYTFSFWAKGEGGNSVSSIGHRDGDPMPRVSFPLSDKWEKYSFTFTTKNETTAGRIIYFQSGTGVQYISHPQLEKGNKATDWTPAPEDQVDKTNVLSSINLSKEGVTIQGNRVDIKGLVTFMNDRVQNLIDTNFLNWTQVMLYNGAPAFNVEPSTAYTFGNWDSDVASTKQIDIRINGEHGSTIQHIERTNANSFTFTTPANANHVVFSCIADMGFNTKGHVDISIVKGSKAVKPNDMTAINGGQILTGSITTNQLSVDKIFGNSAVIAKIQADSVKTATLDAGKITAGILDADRISVVNLSASSITTGSLDGKKARIFNLNASEINAGSLAAERISAGTITKGGTLAVDIRGGGLETYQSSQRTSLLSGRGHTFYRNDREIGSIGTNSWVGDSNYRGLVFDLEPNADYMAWAFKLTPSASQFTTMLSWHKTDAKTNKGFNFADHVNVGTSYNLYLRTLSTTNYASGNRHLQLQNYTWNGRDSVFMRRASGGGGVVFHGSRATLKDGGNAYIEVFRDNTGNAVQSVDIRSRIYTGAPNVHVTSYGTLGFTSSSRRYKICENDIELDYAKRILNINPKSWFDKKIAEGYANQLTTGDEDYEKLPIKRIGGVMAEDMHDAGLEMFVGYDEQDRPNSVEQNFNILYLPLIKDLYKQNDKLSDENEQLKSRLDAMEQQLKQLLA